MEYLLPLIISIIIGVIILIAHSIFSSLFAWLASFRLIDRSIGDMIDSVVPKAVILIAIRVFGVFWLLCAIPYGVILYQTNNPPNTWAAQKSAEIYLKTKYGSTNYSKLSTRPSGVIDYEYGDLSGTLHTQWNGVEYQIEEKIDP